MVKFVLLGRGQFLDRGRWLLIKLQWGGGVHDLPVGEVVSLRSLGLVLVRRVRLYYLLLLLPLIVYIVVVLVVTVRGAVND